MNEEINLIKSTSNATYLNGRDIINSVKFGAASKFKKKKQNKYVVHDSWADFPLFVRGMECGCNKSKMVLCDRQSRWSHIIKSLWWQMSLCMNSMNSIVYSANMFTIPWPHTWRISFYQMRFRHYLSSLWLLTAGDLKWVYHICASNVQIFKCSNV